MPQNYSSYFTFFLNQYAKKIASDTVVQYYKNGGIQAISNEEFFKKIVLFNKALTDKGIKSQDRVGIVSENRLEWLISDMATNSIGIVNVPTFPNFTAEQLKYILSNCGAKAVIVSNKLQLNTILSIKEELEAIQFIVIFDDDLQDEANSVFSFNSLIKEAENRDYKETETAFLENTKNVKLDDILTIIYTSGTTGNPKGVTLTNKNIISNIDSILATGILTKEDTFLSFLPMCHAYERTVIYTFLATGCLVTIAESIETLSNNINEVKPTIITAVPKMLETVKTRILKAIENENEAKKNLILNAIKLSQKYVQATKIPLLDKLKLVLYDKLIFSKIRTRLGGKLNYVVSGGAALMPEVHKFFLAVGIKTIQGYGLTECSPVVSANLPDNIEIGTVGPPLQNVDIRIADNGEILVKGDLIMKGYWQDDKATNDAIDSDRWFHTGDLGEFTQCGSLKITGRLKSIIITSGGKNILPAPIEDSIRMSSYVEHISIYGDNQDYLVGLISPNFEHLKLIANANKIDFSDNNDLISHPKIIKLVKQDIDNHQSAFSKYERVRKFTLLEKPFSIETGELTPKLSMKSNVIFEKYKNEIAELYK